MKKIEIFDSTLRDGAQGEGIAFSVEDKINIVQALDDFGVSYIEAGNPGSNPKDLEFFKRASKLKLKNSTLAAFGSTRRKGISAAEDDNVKSLLLADTKTVVIFGKSWDLHVTEILRASLDENLDMIRDTISFFKGKGKEVFFDAEHFFDGFFANPDYAISALSAACDAGADRIVLCDTNGGTKIKDIERITQKVVQSMSCGVGIHCHNDAGLAVANSIAAVYAGAVQVQGTFLGFGERCGNANLSTIIANLQIKDNYFCVAPENLDKLTQIARTIAEISNISLSRSMPYVGKSAFAHKGGMHVDGVLKVSRSFEHIAPEVVGNERRILMSEVSGRTTILNKIQKVFPNLHKDSPETKNIVDKLKEMEHYGYQFEAAEASFELVVLKEMGEYRPHFEIEHFNVMGGQPSINPDKNATAVIKVIVGERNEITAAEGDGPVHALDCALRRALEVFYPELKKVYLTDYKVRVLDSKDGAASKVRVLIESTDGENTWSTVGVSTNIIDASFKALCDSIEYKFIKG